MKNFSDLPDTDLQILIRLAAHRGGPRVQVIVNDHDPITVVPSASGAELQYRVPCRDALAITLDLLNPDTSAALITSVQVDDFDFIPRYTHWATHPSSPTALLDQPGRWCIQLVRPFYCWLHETTGQGWLFD